MKKLSIIVASIILIGTALNAQSITADDMISQIKFANFESFNNFIITKGFSYDKSSNNMLSDSYTFLGDVYVNSNNVNVKTQNISTLTLWKDLGVTVGFHTSDKGYYLTLLSALIGKGFKSSNTLQYTDHMTISYKSISFPKYLLSVSVYKTSYGVTSYDFELNKSKG